MTLLKMGWLWMTMGLLSGAAIGLFFAREDWLGGYGSWPRRMVRLGHISFLGTGLLMLLAHFSVLATGLPGWASLAMMVGAAAMPTTCFLSAFNKPLRHLFFIPVSGLTLGTLGVLLEVMS